MWHVQMKDFDSLTGSPRSRTKVGDIIVKTWTDEGLWFGERETFTCCKIVRMNDIKFDNSGGG